MAQDGIISAKDVNQMDKPLRRRILTAWKDACGPGVRLPGGFRFSGEGDALTMAFRTAEGLGLGDAPCNMQEDAAAFEGWALALYVHCLHGAGTVRLEGPEGLLTDAEALYTEYPHYSRFLYRALRFSQVCGRWFRLSGGLRARAERFGGFLERGVFTNNLPSGPAGVKGTLESAVESRFAETGSPLAARLGCGALYRQLPVGLFRGSVAAKNRIFTGGTSAIDLWGLSGDTLTVLELKAENKMVGAVTELFFYANYVYDLFVKPGGGFRPNPGHGARGYDALRTASEAGTLKRVRGCLLLDQESCHPLVTAALLKELDRGPVTYGCIRYRADASAETMSLG